MIRSKAALKKANASAVYSFVRFSVIISPPAALEAPRLNHLSLSAEQNLTGQAEDEEVCFFFSLYGDTRLPR